MGLFDSIVPGAAAGGSAGGPWGAVAGAGLGLLGGLQQQGRSIDQAREDRAWQEEMSNSAHQREVVDLKKAGLNPILSAGGSGASTPGGAQAPISDLTSSVGAGISTAQALQRSRYENANIQSDTDNKKLQAALIANQTASTAKDVTNKDLANELLAKTMKSQIKKADLESRTLPENIFTGTIKSLLNGPKQLLDLFQKTNQEFKKDHPSLP